MNSMGMIYKHAQFTIAAGAGQDSDAGLPGIYIPRNRIQHPVLVKAAENGRSTIALLTTLTPKREIWAHYAEELPWSKRGWTLQEKVFSRRVFTFSDQQLFWACRECNLWEETFLETELAQARWYSVHEREFVLEPSLARSFAPSDPQEQTWYQLARLVRNYGGRHLTIQGDAYDAFSAVLKECTTLVSESFVWGLSASAKFELGLCENLTSRASQDGENSHHFP